MSVHRTARAADTGDWRQHAHCGPDTADLFFPADGETATDRAYREAAAVALCEHCPVKAACAAELGALLATGPDHPDRGVWAATTYADRADRGMRRRHVGGAPARVDAMALARLTRAGIPTADIARRFGVTTRTVQRTRAGSPPTAPPADTVEQGGRAA